MQSLARSKFLELLFLFALGAWGFNAFAEVRFGSPPPILVKGETRTSSTVFLSKLKK